MELTIDAADLHAGLFARRDEGGDRFRGDGVQPRARQFLNGKQAFDAVLVVFQRLFLRGESRAHEWQEIVFGEVPQRRYRLPVADADFAFRECGPVRRLHLFGDALVGLLGALANRFAVPGELVPPILALGLLIDRHEDSSSARRARLCERNAPVVSVPADRQMCNPGIEILGAISHQAPDLKERRPASLETPSAKRRDADVEPRGNVIFRQEIEHQVTSE